MQTIRKQLVLVSTLAVLAVTAFVSLKTVEGRDETPGSPDHQTREVVIGATAFLRTLTPDQRQKVEFVFARQEKSTNASFHRTPDGGVAPGAPAGGAHGGGFGQGPPGGFIGEQYGQAVWSNYPVSDVTRPGIRLGVLTTGQRNAAMHLLQTVLSPMGYQKVRDIMGSDQALTDAGTNFASGEAVYTVAIFGEPSLDKPWMIEFGGHHLGLNIVIAGSKGVMTPTLTGAQPAIYKRGDKTVRVLAKENDTAFALLDSLSKEQQKKAILNYEINDLILGPGHSGEKIQPEGIKGAKLNANQRALLMDVISQWAGIVNDSYAKPRMAEIQSDLNDTYFAWSGPTSHEPNKNGTSYYRIQGPHLIIEFSPQGVGGDPTMHVHTIYRDPTNDYGIKFTGAQ